MTRCFIQNDRARLIIVHSKNFALSGNIDGPCNVCSQKVFNALTSVSQLFIAHSFTYYQAEQINVSKLYLRKHSESYLLKVEQFHLQHCLDPINVF